MSSLLSYHIFSFFISNIFENFKFGRNFSKFTAGMGCRLVAVSVKIGGNRRLPIGKENTGPHPLAGPSGDCFVRKRSGEHYRGYVDSTLHELAAPNGPKLCIIVFSKKKKLYIMALPLPSQMCCALEDGSVHGGPLQL